MVCKIDLEKAYDKVDWSFLKWVLTKKEFSKRWTNWIMGCLDHPHFSIMINGSSKGFFSSSRGIRQGDPLSHFLFTLVADAFSALMAKVMDCSIIRGFSEKEDGPVISQGLG